MNGAKTINATIVCECEERLTAHFFLDAYRQDYVTCPNCKRTYLVARPYVANVADVATRLMERQKTNTPTT